MSDDLEFRVPLKKRAVDNSHDDGYAEKSVIKKKKQEENVICIESDDDDESNFQSFSQSTADQSSSAGLRVFGAIEVDPASQTLDSPGFNTQPSPAAMITSTGVNNNKLTTASPDPSIARNTKKTTSNRVSLSPSTTRAGDSLANLGGTTVAKTQVSSHEPAEESSFRLTKQKLSLDQKASKSDKKPKPSKTTKKRKASDAKTKTRKKSAVEPLHDDFSFLDPTPKKASLEDVLKKLSDDDDDEHDDLLDDYRLKRPPNKKPNTETEKMEATRPAYLGDTDAHNTSKSTKELTASSSQKKKETSKATSSRVESKPSTSTQVTGDVKQAKSQKKKEKKGMAASSNKQQQQAPVETSEKVASTTCKETTILPNRPDSKVLEVESAPIQKDQSTSSNQNEKVKKKKAAPKAKATTKTTETALSADESNKTGNKNDTTNMTVSGTETQKGKVKSNDTKKKQTTTSEKAQATSKAKSSQAEKPSFAEQVAAPKPSPNSKETPDKSKTKTADAAQATNNDIVTDKTKAPEAASSSTASKPSATEYSDGKDKSTVKKDDKKEKLKVAKAKAAGTLAKKKKPTFQEQVLRQMVFTCKPYTTATLAKELKVTEQQLNFTILSMLDKGLVMQKEFTSAKGRTKNLLWANLESKAKEAIPFEFSPSKYRDAHQELALLSKQEKGLDQELQNVNSLPCNKGLSAQLEEEEDALAQLKKKLEDAHARIEAAKADQQPEPKQGNGGRFMAKPKNEAQLARERCPRRMKMRINAMRQEWKTRKGKCKDFVDNIAEAMEKKPKDVLKILDVETDEDAGMTMPPKYQIDP